MKISIAWLFDHIDADVFKVDVPDLIGKINQITAEVEHWETIKTDISNVAFAQIKSITSDVHADIPEWKIDIRLPNRSDAKEGNWYLVIKEGAIIRWAMSTDFGASKDMILPAVAECKSFFDGLWKKKFEQKDVVFTVDNKSITHRPDLWSHRGFAREVAAILDLKLKPLEDFILSKRIIPYESKSQGTQTNPFALAIENPKLCKRFAGYSISRIEHSASLLWMLTRLSRVDSRSVDALVDFTNYVMLDIGQPMHAFDADTLSSKSIGVRTARNKEKLMLLDATEIELTEQDIVIVDGDRPISLAGIMGGKDSGISCKTTAVFLESANFDAITIRRSAQRHKLRSEASARFEKSLDPNQNTDAIVRFLRLLEDAGMPFQGSDEVISLGALMQPPLLSISQKCIEDRLGTSVAPAFVESTLRKLDFSVRQEKKDSGIVYHIDVPAFRALKDIGIKEDIVEEIGRFYGWSNIEPVLPLLQTNPKPVQWVYQASKIKHLLSYGLLMRELWTYSFFDESYLRSIDWDPGDTLKVQDPVSENWHRMVTTLIPNMFKAVSDNAADYQELKFYEWGRCWSVQGDGIESKKLTGIMWNKREKLDFYACKAQLHQLFGLLNMKVEWQQLAEQTFSWQNQSHTAHIMYNGNQIGTAGLVDTVFFKRIADGSAFIFELDAGILENSEKPLHRYVPSSKYPPIERDVSLLAPLSLTVAQIAQLISGVDQSIRHVSLVDMFQKKEWKKERALTFRYRIQADKTLTKAEADKVSDMVHVVMEKVGVQIR